MTEQLIEKIIIDSINEKLESNNLEDIQVIGVWQTTNQDKVKGLEDENVEGVVSINVAPRRYETFTIPDAEFTISVALILRADIDYTGQKLLQITEIISGIFHEWQKSYSAINKTFSMDSFLPTGFRLDGGECGCDETKTIWTYAQSFVLKGIIQA